MHATCPDGGRQAAGLRSMKGGDQPRLDMTCEAHEPTPGTVADHSAMAQTRKLYRSRTNRKLGGGLTQYLNADATCSGCCSWCSPW
jgi:hypothetical protein